MMKHYKPILLSIGVFFAFAVTPAESQKEPYIIQNKIPQRIIEVPPADFSKVEENSRELYELKCELEWLESKHKSETGK